MSNLEAKKVTKVTSKYMCQDHHDNFFPGKHQMCAAYGITLEEFNMRKKFFKNLKDCLEPEDSFPWHIEEGRNYRTFKDLCSAYGKLKTTVLNRCEKNKLSLHDALVTDSLPHKQGPRNLDCYKRTDHLGQEFATKTEMAKFWGMDARTFTERMNSWDNDLKRCLETPLTKTGTRCKPVYDHEGRRFASVSAMCAAWGVTRCLFEGRKKQGWTLRECLTIPKRMELKERRLFNALNDRNIQYYYRCSVRNIFEKMHKQFNQEDFLEYLECSAALFKTKTKSAWHKKKIEDMIFDFSVCFDHDNNVTGIIVFSRHRKIFHDEEMKTLGGTHCYSYSEFVRLSLLEYLNLPYMRIRKDQTKFISEMVDDFLVNTNNYKKNHNMFIKENDYINYSLHDWEMAPGIA